MAYCDIDDVKGLNVQRTYSSTSKPTTTQVEEYITQIAAEIDSKLQGRGYTTPVTTPADFVTTLKLGNSQGAAALAEIGMFPEAFGTPGGSPHGQLMWKMYQAFLTWLMKGDLPVAVDGKAGPTSFFEQHTGSAEPSEDYAWREPKFRKGKEI